MLQIVQDLKKGDTLLEEIPAPLVKKGHVLIKTHRTLVSLGTEKMLVEFGRGSLIAKARQQPEKVKMVLQKIKTEGLMPTLEAVFNKLDEPLPLGYCNAGEVVAIGDDVTEFSVGERVASNGHHAEFVCVPKNLVAKIPDNVSYDEASFTVIGSIGLQGIRLLNPTLGEKVVVVGLGLIGLITAQLLLANGCQVIGLDFDQQKVDLANQMGVNAFNASNVDVVKVVESLTKEIGADGVVITASTKSNDVISQSAQMCRKRGRIILVGVIGLNIQRSDFYKKELTFQVSCTYGPGRYDDNYEIRGIDYPVGYVRWTQQRNFEAILHAISTKRLDVENLITDRVPLKDYMRIYGDMGKGSIASILEYSSDNYDRNTLVSVNKVTFKESKAIIGVIGAGNFTKMTMLPALKKTKAINKYISSAGGVTAKSLAKKYGFILTTTDYKEILNDKEVDLVFITTRHDLHAKLVIECILSQKHVFVEKPLALSFEQLEAIEAILRDRNTVSSITVGFNRRFSPFIRKAKQLIGDETSSLNMIATMNAGHIPSDFWVHDMNVGGGRIIGEACHYIDLMVFLSGSKVKSIVMSGLGGSPAENTDNAVLILKFENGAQGVVNYFSNGSKIYSKERIELYSQGRTLVIDNFRSMKGYGFKSFSSMQSSIDKGHKQQFSELIKRVREGGEPLIPIDEVINTTKASLCAIESMKKGVIVEL